MLLVGLVVLDERIADLRRNRNRQSSEPSGEFLFPFEW